MLLHYMNCYYCLNGLFLLWTHFSFFKSLRCTTCMNAWGVPTSCFPIFTSSSEWLSYNAKTQNMSNKLFFFKLTNKKKRECIVQLFISQLIVSGWGWPAVTRLCARIHVVGVCDTLEFRARRFVRTRQFLPFRVLLENAAVIAENVLWT